MWLKWRPTNYHMEKCGARKEEAALQVRSKQLLLRAWGWRNHTRECICMFQGKCSAATTQHKALRQRVRDGRCFRGKQWYNGLTRVRKGSWRRRICVNVSMPHKPQFPLLLYQSYQGKVQHKQETRKVQVNSERRQEKHFSIGLIHVCGECYFILEASQIKGHTVWNTPIIFSSSAHVS